MLTKGFLKKSSITLYLKKKKKLVTENEICYLFNDPVTKISSWNDVTPLLQGLASSRANDQHRKEALFQRGFSDGAHASPVMGSMLSSTSLYRKKFIYICNFESKVIKN